MKSREIREMTDKEILDALEDQKEALFNLRFQKASGQLEDSNEDRSARAGTGGEGGQGGRAWLTVASAWLAAW
jgi:ribosomal protein L29